MAAKKTAKKATKKVARKVAKKATAKPSNKGAKPEVVGEDEEVETLGFFDPENAGQSRARREEVEAMPWQDRRAFLSKRKRRLVNSISLMMAAGEWQRGKTAKVIAKVEDMALNSVEHAAAEASRLIDFTTQAGRPELVRTARARLLQIATENGLDRVQALKTLLEHLGEMRQKIKLSRDEDFFAGWGEDQLEQYAATGKLPEGSAEG